MSKVKPETRMPVEIEDEPEVTEIQKNENETSEPEAPKSQGFDIKKSIAERVGAPTQEMIEAWKQMYSGDVFATQLGRNDLFIFRSINRSEWKMLQSQLGAQKEKDETVFMEAVIKKAVLYPSLHDPAKFAGIKAGTIPTLFEQISWYSNFMPPELAISMVYEL